MTRRIVMLALLALAAPQAQAEEAARSVDSLAWLAGCWEYEGQEPGSGEHWMPPAGGVLLGVSRTVRAGRSTLHEFVRIATAEGGGLEYVAQPSGQAETHFRLTSLSANEVVFENPEHAFPQRITYRLVQNGRLHARIEGTQNGEARAVDFPMSRTPCEGQPPAHRR